MVINKVGFLLDSSLIMYATGNKDERRNRQKNSRENKTKLKKRTVMISRITIPVLHRCTYLHDTLK